ncbi:MAG: arylsulfatase [Bacteroidetes bacterium QH_9_67_14]|nr:MAG: arylsulfatase [Bacteroidetes bacterium QH_9_67_14]
MLSSRSARCVQAWLLTLLLLVGGVGGPRAAAQEPAAQPEARPNIVILFADDLGWGDLSSYGHPAIETPNLDRLAAQGARFTSFYTAPVCVPSRTQLLTGRYMSRMDFQGGTGADGEGRLPPSERTLAEVLEGAGYSTHMLGKWHLGYQKEAYLPTNHGFDTWYGMPYSNDYKKPWVQTEEPLAMYQGTADGETEIIDRDIDQSRLTTGYTRRAVERIQQESGKAGEPFFLYLAYNMPHLPIHTAERFRGRSGAGRYADVVETIDWSVGQVMQALEKQGVAGRTIVVFASDNGPWLDLPDRMLRGGNKPWHQGTTGPLRGSKQSTYDGGTRVPAILRWPGRVEAGRRADGLAALQDVFVSLVEAAGAGRPEREMDGKNLLPWLTGEEAQSPREQYAYVYGGELQAMRVGPWKLRLAGEEPQLFHLETDPAARWNRAEAHPERVERMRRRMQRYAERIGASVPEAPRGEGR